MKKLLSLLLVAIVVSFSGCGSKDTGVAAAATGLEGQDVSTYLVGKYVDVKTATQKLQDAGYEVIASYEPVKKGTTLVFTNDALKAEGAKPGKAHAAVLRLFIDQKEKMISFVNPVYFGKAYMQEFYNHAVFNAELEKIKSAFEGLSPSADKMKFDDLAGFHFMVGMPYYSDTNELAKGEQEALLTKAREYKKGKELVYELKLSDGSTLLGYDLGKRTKKFVEKIGRANAAILPYSIMVENGVATCMDAKYYIALSYPLLTMTEFMTISTVPGAIEKDLSKPF